MSDRGEIAGLAEQVAALERKVKALLFIVALQLLDRSGANRKQLEELAADFRGIDLTSPTELDAIWQRLDPLMDQPARKPANSDAPR